MPKYPDALGYLYDLSTAVGEPWFTMLCDLAAVRGMSKLDQPAIDVLSAILSGQASYTGAIPATAMVRSGAALATADFLESLSDFSNFKLLNDTLKVDFNRRITVIFGSNGSGKSSLCKSLKLLANIEPPLWPLHNVRRAAGVTTTPTFSYKFKSDTVVQQWTQNAGYGQRSSTVKYFDTGIAIRNVKNAIDPGRIIEVTPFKLHVFELVKMLTSEFRVSLQQIQQKNITELKQSLETLRSKFVLFKDRPLSSINEKTIQVLASEIKSGEAFTQQTSLKEKVTIATELERATSEEGLKLLKAEHRDLEAFLASLATLLDAAEGLWMLEPVAKNKDLYAKQTEQALIAKSLISETKTLESLLSLLYAASPLCNFEGSVEQECPLCNRKLSETEVELFKQYHGLLTGAIERDITALRNDLEKAKGLVAEVAAIDRNEWDKFSTLDTSLFSKAKTEAGIVVSSCVLDKEPTIEAREAFASLRALSVQQHTVLQQKAKAIEVAAAGRDGLLRQLAELRVEIEPLQYVQTIADNLDLAKDIQLLADEAAFWDVKLSFFTSLLKKITESAKEAHDDLVVGDFEARLNTEYKALTEKQMPDFGVRLARKGSDGSVTVMPQIGGKDLEGVLSEGEQRVHALALFFAEIESCPQSVLVFDDPVSSFDYNYIANYCFRLRDFAVKHQHRQIIVLSHNWEFFAQLQQALNIPALHGQIGIQVLENCANVAEYKEKTNELKDDITTILAESGEPTKAKKEELAGKMRKLIEAIVNTHVFNNQRQQYKQRRQSVSEFHHYTKLVPLKPDEATLLHDLFNKLSISEHDDSRNEYVNTDKAMFQSRYDSIIAVEAAVMARK